MHTQRLKSGMRFFPMRWHTRTHTHMLRLSRLLVMKGRGQQWRCGCHGDERNGMGFVVSITLRRQWELIIDRQWWLVQESKRLGTYKEGKRKMNRVISRSAGSRALIIKLFYKQGLVINNAGLSFSKQALLKLKRKACQKKCINEGHWNISIFTTILSLI